MYCSKKSRLLGLTLILLNSAQSFASGPFGLGTTDDENNSPLLPSIAKESKSWENLRDALQSIKDTPAIKSLLNNNQVHSLSISQKVSNGALETTKLQHYYKGLEVMGSMAFHHRGTQTTLVRDAIKAFDLETTPSLTAEDAVAIAKSVAGDRDLSQAPELKILPSDDDSSANLVYWIELGESGADGARELIVDAHSGNVIGNLSKRLTIAPIQVYSAKNRGLSITTQTDDTGANLLGCEFENLSTKNIQKLDAGDCQKQLEGALDIRGQCQIILNGDPVIVQPKDCTQYNTKSIKLRPLSLLNTRTDLSSAQAESNSNKVLQYFLNTHQRNSYDNRGSAVISVVHAGIQYANAHWDTQSRQMVYGDGDGIELGDMTQGLDVAGHEMTHGITSTTAKLLNMGESGALNEAYSDFFGKMIDYDGDWRIGKKLFLDSRGTAGIRDLANPHNIKLQLEKGKEIPYPAHMKEKFPTSGTCDQNNDNCWVHINATIPGHASYLMVQAIGKEKAERLYYTVLTQGLSSRDSIKSAAKTTKQLCAQMYDAATCKQVEQVFAQVGL